MYIGFWTLNKYWYYTKSQPCIIVQNNVKIVVELANQCMEYISIATMNLISYLYITNKFYPVISQ